MTDVTVTPQGVRSTVVIATGRSGAVSGQTARVAEVTGITQPGVTPVTQTLRVATVTETLRVVFQQVESEVRVLVATPRKGRKRLH